jgi:ABC-type Fe3+-hydroxamate transport system substrate-binding protein
VLLVGTHATGAPALAPLEALTAIPAVRDHRVHLVDGDLLFRPGPRVVDGIERLAALLHPKS